MVPLHIVSETAEKIYSYIKEKFSHAGYYVITLTPQNTEYSINQIKEIGREIRIHQPILRIYVLERFDRSSPEAQNAFLKILEEPPANIEFILHTVKPYSLLPTILSRIKTVILSKASYEAQTNFAEEIDSLLKDNPGKILSSKLLQVKTKESALELIIQFLILYRNKLTVNPNSSAILKEALNMYRLIEDNNLNPQLAIDHLLIFIIKTFNMKIESRENSE